jgi:putative membrane protein
VRLTHNTHLAAVTLAAIVVSACVNSGCGNPTPATGNAGSEGDPSRGAALIAEVGCGGCHIIPGITAADGLVGPPLNHMGKRVFIAGTLQNNKKNMIVWLQNPQAIAPGNAMPNMGLSYQEALDITAYLHTLE